MKKVVFSDLDRDNNTQRIEYIDFLRGIAVVLMLEQHLTIWFWKHNLSFAFKHLDKYGIIFILNGVGGLAAPIFITLSGYSAYLLIVRHKNSRILLVKRGFVLLFLGYLLNIFTPRWFTVESWYVLHLIGFSLVMSPFFIRVSNFIAIVAAFLIIVLTTCGQTLLNTPLYLKEIQMSNATDLPVGLLRIIFFEGHFPVFPWISFFIFGICSARWTAANKSKNIIVASFVFVMLFISIVAINILCPPSLWSSPFSKLISISMGFYPLLLSVTSLLLASTLFLLWLTHCAYITNSTTGTFFVNLGRLSLTIFFFHIIIIREIGGKMGLLHGASTTWMVVLVILVITLTGIGASIWKKYGLRFSLEWLTRKITG